MAVLRRKFNIWFLYGCMLYFIVGGWCFLFFEKGEIELWMNQHHHAFWDFLFYYSTSLGNGLFYAAVLIYIGFYRLGWFVAGSIAFAATGLLTQFLKQIVFTSSMRPGAYFLEKTEESLHFVEGVMMHSYLSFPSGHTATAFSLFLLLSLMNQKWWWGTVCFLLALIVGTSRVYLLQHFWVDVFAGAVLGVIITFLVIKFTLNNDWFLSKNWTRKNWFSLFRKQTANNQPKS